ncbi:helix-turn-helix domain-containing protein [Geminicoccus harenae]|uniref:helix-turn-helix domain-containing protein n=1 Tax=Geminicoccus harenae TaxID=2498453 RepID=UPI00168B4445|nr:helix-turn-helix domain-containing protein [Geminicoccus harenae]
MNMMDIGEVAMRSGASPSTLRYYEEVGLIRSVGRHGLRRQFDPSVLLKLSLIELGKVAGFSLGEIAGMFGDDETLNIPRADLHAKADELGRQITKLRVLRDAMRHVADCPAPSHLQCPSFRKLLKSVSSRKAGGRAGARRTDRPPPKDV